ncbi:MAG: DNA-binding protein [archaeon]|jgi:predicted DNA-binding protein with PD1-like motif|nr:DNA-binding protein [archaeon]
MDWTRSGDDIFIRLDPGEEIHAGIREVADKENVNAAAITSGIGRTRDNAYGFMNAEHIYQRWTLESPCELVTLQGNFARMADGSGFTHLHATFTNDDVEVHAGHMFHATVEVVAEIHMRVMSKAIMTRCPMADSEFVALSFE